MNPAREVLNNIYNTNKPLVIIISTETGYFINSAHSKDLISNMISSNLIINLQSVDIGNNMLASTYISTELGSLVQDFMELEEYVINGHDECQDCFDVINYIRSILNKYDYDEIEGIISVLTIAEQDAYTKFFNIYSENERKASEFKPVLQSIFDMSVALGQKDSDPTRTNDYVFKKCMEELGEMAVEDQIENGLSYKLAGSDGVKGEAVDLAICAMDMFALQCPNKSAQEIEKEFLEYMVVKLTKWKEKIQEF